MFEKGKEILSAFPKIKGLSKIYLLLLISNWQTLSLASSVRNCPLQAEKRVEARKRVGSLSADVIDGGCQLVLQDHKVHRGHPGQGGRNHKEDGDQQDQQKEAVWPPGMGGALFFVCVCVHVQCKCVCICECVWMSVVFMLKRKKMCA